jgi:hypothetical protein
MNMEQIIDQLVANKWSRSTVLVWHRAQCECEYCGKCLTDGPDEYYFDSHVDHIVPSAGNGPENLALTCKACNFIKRDQDFRCGDASDIRSALIERATAFITERREVNRARLADDLRLLRQLGVTSRA